MRIKLASIILAVLVLSITVTASMIVPANENAKENAKAPENSPVIGENWDLERVDFIHYAKSVNPARPTKTDLCYKLMGVKWNTVPVSYVINPSNTYNLSEGFVVGAITDSATAWDAATTSNLFNLPSVDYSATYGVQNYQNAIDFGDLDAGIIGVTSVWYSRRGKQIIEFDMRLNTDFRWGDAMNPPIECTYINGTQTCNFVSLMDLQNIATHELGHAVGMDDIYSSACTSVTMYGYSDYGDVTKRTLEQPDITGLVKMYG